MRHSGGRASLVYSEHPYDTIRTAVAFNYGDTIQHLAISQSGRFVAATLHQSTGRQAIVVSDVEQMKETGRFSYQVIAAEGSPEFPSWSPDETTLYWSAYTNGVSNVYRYRSDEGTVEALSNTLRGLFRPIYVDAETLFAFEFGAEGFTRCSSLMNRSAEYPPSSTTDKQCWIGTPSSRFGRSRSSRTSRARRQPARKPGPTTGPPDYKSIHSCR